MHLQQVKAPPRALTEEELIEHVELQHKNVRRAARTPEDEGTDRASSVATGVEGRKEIKVIREIILPRQPPLSLIDAAIAAKTAQVQMLAYMDGDREESIAALNEDIYALLNRKAEIALSQLDEKY